MHDVPVQLVDDLHPEQCQANDKGHQGRGRVERGVQESQVVDEMNLHDDVVPEGPENHQRRSHHKVGDSVNRRLVLFVQGVDA